MQRKRLPNSNLAAFFLSWETLIQARYSNPKSQIGFL